MSANWWANKLGTQQPQQQRGGIVLAPQQPQPVYHQQQAPAPQHQQQPVDDDPNRKLGIREAISRFSGGESARVEGGLSCPACGSKTGYTEFRGMAGAAAGVMGARPAPHCYECGYNGKFMQGDQANWA